MSPLRTVRTEHLGGEMLLVDFGPAAIVSDHPERMGGTGKGPMPGELLKGALAASAVLAMARVAQQQSIPIGRLQVACGSDMVTERREDGPLPSTTVLTGFVLFVSVTGAVSDEQIGRLEAAASDCPVARAITGKVAIAEHNRFEVAPPRRNAAGTSFLISQMLANRPPKGNVLVRKAGEVSQVTGEYLGHDRVLLRWARSAFVIGGEGDGAARDEVITPEDLVLAALSACTSVFVARSAALSESELEIHVECSGKFAPVGSTAAERGVQITKTVHLVGAFDARQREVLSHFSDHCAVGETLRRAAGLSVVFERGKTGLTASGDFAEQASRFFALAGCGNGACCVA